MEQIIANGLYLGAQYALIALGLTLIFALMNVLNFAHGQMYVIGGFVTYTVYAQLGLPFSLRCSRPPSRLRSSGRLIEKFLFRPVIQKSVARRKHDAAGSRHRLLPGRHHPAGIRRETAGRAENRRTASTTTTTSPWSCPMTRF